MGMLRKFRKSVVKESVLRFPVEMYNNVVGSLIITHYILSENKPEATQIIKTWKRIKKNGLDFFLDDEKFIQKVLSKFGMEPQWGNFAMVQGELNVLFAPYIDNGILPIREDGIYSRTLREGKIYPIEAPGVEANTL